LFFGKKLPKNRFELATKQNVGTISQWIARSLTHGQSGRLCASARWSG
jgi:hypothetical protein